MGYTERLFILTYTRFAFQHDADSFKDISERQRVLSLRLTYSLMLAAIAEGPSYRENPSLTWDVNVIPGAAAFAKLYYNNNKINLDRVLTHMLSGTALYPLVRLSVSIACTFQCIATRFYEVHPRGPL